MDQIFDDKTPLRRFRKGQILIYEGDPVENLYLLLSGYVKVSNILQSGNQRTIIIYAPGDMFPIDALLTEGAAARYFYECMTDIEVRVETQRQFQEKLHDKLEIGEEIIAYATKINQQTAQRVETLTAESARHKVVSLFNYLADKAGSEKAGKIQLNIPLTSQEIANMCGLTRETTSVQLLRLKSARVISGRRFLVIDPVKLAKLKA